MDDWDERDLLIDAWISSTRQEVELALGRFLSGLSDDPRDAAFDALYLLLLGSGFERIVAAIPLRNRALAIARTLPEDLPGGSTTGLEEASQGVKDLMRGAIREVAQEVSQLATQMTLFRQNGFREAAAGLLERQVDKIVEKFGQALLVWDRAVLDRISELQPEEPVWIYAGPQDRKNRPFCSAIVRLKHAYTRQGIENLNAHPLLADYVPPNVFMLCGGFNCRHAFIPVSRGFAEANELEVIDAD